ncbi:DoxX family protein [Streptomyces sp. NPDC002536]
MSVDTRTPRTPTGGSSSGYDDQPALSTVKVPSDPAQVSVNHLSFRVQLARPPRAARQFAGADRTDGLPTLKSAARRRAPVVWSGRTGPGDSASTQLLDAVRESGLSGPARTAGGGDGGATQVLPRIAVDEAPATVIGPRGPDGPTGPAGADATRLLPRVRPNGGARDEDPYGYSQFDEPGSDYETEDDEDIPRRQRPGDSARHAYYPDRRMNLGVVLLPLRIFLGLISIYAGMGKLCDPVYFDGGKRGSMVAWLTALHPWAVAAPLRSLALSHPVGSGLTVAFLQIIVGILTIFGLWQRLAGAVGMLLSAVLLVTVSWRTAPVYQAPDIICLAAWSPLVIAGAPCYSVDGKLVGEAWRRLGPRAELWALRRRVLRRGTVMATVLIGLSLLTGSMLGGAVRSSRSVQTPGLPAAPPSNSLPGTHLPQRPGSSSTTPGAHGATTPGAVKPSPTGHKQSGPSATPSAPGTSHSPAGTPGGAGTPGHGGVHSAPQTPHQQPAPAAPRSSSSSAGGSAGSTGDSSGSSSGSSGGHGGGALGGLLG